MQTAKSLAELYVGLWKRFKTLPPTEGDIAAINRAEKKRERKNLKRLRDYSHGGYREW